MRFVFGLVFLLLSASFLFRPEFAEGHDPPIASVSVTILNDWDGESMPLFSIEKMLAHVDLAIAYSEANDRESVPRLLLKKGTLLRALRKIPESLDAVEESYRLAPDDLKVASAYIKARFLTDRDVPKMLELLQELETRHPESVEIAKATAIISFVKKQYQVAKVAAARVLKEEPTNTDAAFILAQSSLFMENKPYELLPQIEKALSIGPGVVERKYGALVSAYGLCKMLMGDFEQGELALRQSWGMKAQDHGNAYNLHGMLVHNSKPSAAKLFIDTLDESILENDRMKTIRITHLIEAGELQEAERLMGSLNLTDPVAKDISKFNQTSLLVRKEKFEEAVELIAESIIHEEQIQDPFVLLGLLLNHTAGAGEATPEYTWSVIRRLTSARGDPDKNIRMKVAYSREGSIQIAIIKASLGEWSEAIDDLKSLKKGSDEAQLNALIAMCEQEERYDLRKEEHRKIWRPSALFPIGWYVVEPPQKAGELDPAFSADR